VRLVNGWSGKDAAGAGSLPFELCVERRAENFDGDPVRVLDRISPQSLRLGEARKLRALTASRGHEPEPAPEGVPSGVTSAATLERCKLRDRLRPLQGQLQRACGCRPIGPVYVGAGWQRGCVTCKSVHACPVCAARRMLERAAEVQRAIKWWTEQSGSVGMLTLTVRHDAGFSLKRLRSVVCEAWRRLWTGREGRELRGRVAHFVRAHDSTWGTNGWHPHLHALLFSGLPLPEEWLQAVRERWARIVSALMPMAMPRTDAVGVTYTAGMTRAEYICQLGLELNAVTTKQAAPGHATPWQIARMAADEADRGERDGPMGRLWREWCKGMKGARHLTWSRGLRAAVQLTEHEDSLAPEQSDAKDNPWVVIVQPRDWLRSRDAGLRPSLLMKLSRNGPASLLAAFRAVGFWARGPEPHFHDGILVDAWRVWHPSIAQQLNRIGRHERERKRPHQPPAHHHAQLQRSAGRDC